MISWTKVFVIALPLIVESCAQSPYERGGHPAGFTRYDVEQDYRECEYKAGLANDQHFFSQSSPFPFGAGSQSPADHARALCMAFRPSMLCGIPVWRRKATGSNSYNCPARRSHRFSTRSPHRYCSIIFIRVATAPVFLIYRGASVRSN